MTKDPYRNVVTLDVSRPIWERFYAVNTLIVVGSRQEGGTYDLAPKHMAMPIGWQNYFGFVCTPRHRTYLNIKQRREFTVSYPRPSQVLEASLTAAPRCEDDTRPALQTLSTFPAREVDAQFLADAYAYLECRMHRIVDGFGENSLIIGAIIAAHVDKEAVRGPDTDDADLIYRAPLLAFLSPNRFAHITDSRAFPFPAHFKK